MRFFDCNAFFGLPAHQRPLAPVATAEQLLREMDRCGVDRALVWHIAQHDASVQAGNRLLAEAIRHHPRLRGCWCILPAHTGEQPPPAVFFRHMREAHIGSVRIFPATHRYLANRLSLAEWLEPMVEQRIPLLVSVKRGMEWRDVYALLADFPELTCVVCDHGSWGMDRYFRPLLERYPRVHIDISQYFLDGGLEALVADVGASRLLFGSGFPESYLGGMMLALRHARLPDEAKVAIASGNLERLLAESDL
jgi:predicted TIM-barrel fold metal-dependent hydrolase